MISRERIEEILKDAGALLEGHFKLTSGRHAGYYMQCAQILQYPAYTKELLGNAAEQLKDDEVDLVIAPALGGVLVSYELGAQLGVRALFAEREDGKMTLRRGFQIPQGAKVVVAEDVTTTGGTVFEIIELVKSLGGEVVAVALLVDRSGGSIDFGVKTCAVYQTSIPSYEADECPICKEGKLPVVKPGSRTTV